MTNTPNFASIAFVMAIATSKTIPAGQTYIEQGKVFKKLFWIKKGILRSYYLTDNGEEKTLIFRAEEQFGGVAECIFGNLPSKQNWQAVEDCELLELDYDKLLAITDTDISLTKTRLAFVQNMLLEVMMRLESFVLEKPEERYLTLMTQKPHIVQRVPDKHIASYIGVTPVSLSRIRKRLSQKKTPAIN